MGTNDVARDRSEGTTYEVTPRSVCLKPILAVTCPECGEISEGKFNRVRHVKAGTHEFWYEGRVTDDA